MARRPATTRPDSPAQMGDRLRMLRIAYGIAQGHTREMRQVEIAKLCDVGPQAWNNFEAGRGRIGVDNAIKIAQRTGASLDYLYFGDKRLLPLAIAREIERLEAEEGIRLA